MGESDRYYFSTPTSRGWYSFDDYHNVYSEDGTLVHSGLSALESDEYAPSFYIHDVPYWFGQDGLLSVGTDRQIRGLHPWHSKYYFHTSNGVYYFDYRRNVYSDKGTLVYDSSLDSELRRPRPLMFYIDGASYWFDLDVLRCQSSIGTSYRVHTWQSEPKWNSPNKKYRFFASGHLYYLDDSRNLYLDDGTLMYNGSSSVLTDTLDIPNFQIDGTPYWLHKDGLLYQSISGITCRALAWIGDWCSLNDNPNSLQKRLKGELSTSSSGYSSLNSLSIESTTDGRQTPDISLVSDSHPDHIQGTRSSSQHKTTKKATEKAQPERKRGTRNHLRCPFCDKEFRRPVALREHIYYHTGEKPNVCPFEDCNTGFATRSNMRRHFTTHRAECTLEEYERSILQSTGTASAPIQSYNPYRLGMHPLHVQSGVGHQTSAAELGEATQVSIAPDNLHGSDSQRTAHTITTERPVPEKIASDLPPQLVKGGEEGEEAGTESELEAPEETEDSQVYLTSVSEKSLDGLIQPRPTPPDIDKKYYFHASSRFYYFDSHRRLYLEDGTLVHDGSLGLQTDGRRSPLTFFIDGVPHWFNRDNLMYQNADGIHSVHVWQSGSETISPNMSMHEMFHHLLHHGCTDLSLEMDTQQDTAIIINGGGFGDIWLGKLNDGTQVAIKAWRSSIIEQCDYKILKRATREIYFWSKLKHENIQPLMGVIIFKGHYLGMVSRWMENGHLHGYMRKNPGFDRYRMSVQVASGLAYMHQRNAVHGDLRTANILVSSDGVARLTDFGLSTMSEAGLAFSETTTTQAGTVRWASPEHLVEGTPNSKESDVYALGMTILEIFTGTVPYYPECQKEIQVMMKLQKGIHPTRSTDHFREDGRGNQMWKLLVSCWDRTPGFRPTAEEVIAALDSIASM